MLENDKSEPLIQNTVVEPDSEQKIVFDYRSDDSSFEAPKFQKRTNIENEEEKSDDEMFSVNRVR